MFGIETFEVLIFLRQAGLAVAGATALWGAVFLFLSTRAQDARSAALWHGVSQKLILLFFPALAIFAAAWATIAISECVFCASAHEGISLAQSRADFIAAIFRQFVLYLAAVALGLAGFLTFLLRRRFFCRNLLWFFGVFFGIVSFFLLYPWAPVGAFRENLSVALHNWHSILTVGSVVMVDFLFIALKNNLRPYLVKIFPLITGGIWLGLGLDFVSTGLVFDEAFSASPRILFMQTLVGIVIINGVLLSGPLARAMISYQKDMKSMALSGKFSAIVGLSGAVSIVGWMGITALDGFRSLTLGYWQVFALYFFFVILAFLLRETVDRTLARFVAK